MCRIFIEMLTPRFMQKNTYSNSFSHSKGAQKGCNLSPLRFSLFINDLESYIESNPSGSCQLNGCRLRLLMFADDIVLLADLEKGLQGSINRLEEFAVVGTFQLIPKKQKYLVLINLPVAHNLLYLLSNYIEKVKQYIQISRCVYCCRINPYLKF